MPIRTVLKSRTVADYIREVHPVRRTLPQSQVGPAETTADAQTARLIARAMTLASKQSWTDAAGDH